MEKHSEHWVRELAPEILKIVMRRFNRITDIEVISTGSPLQPGVRLQLAGGYEYVNPWWLNGKPYYQATFQQFLSSGPNEMPVAFVVLDDEIHMIEGTGLVHLGKYALLKLLYIADWTETETVTVHIVNQCPNDLVQLYDSHPFGTEIESHATYRIEAET